MKLLKPGTGNQGPNRKLAVKYITENIIDAKSIDEKSGQITSTDGISYQVSAYAETPAAFVSTPNVDNSKNSIYASGLPALMFRQLRHDKRSFVYEVDPQKIFVKPNSSSAQWSDIEKVSTRIWVCTEESVNLINKLKKP